MIKLTSRFQDAIASCFHWRDQPIAVLVTPEFEGIFRNGGIGTYYLTLSQNLKAAGCYVIVLLAQNQTSFRGESCFASVDHIFSTGEWRDTLRLSESEQRRLMQDLEAEWTAFERYCILAYVGAIATQFPNAKIYIEFPEMLGLATHTIQAKRAGLLSKNCLIAVTLHSGHEWIQEAHGRYVHPAPQWLFATAQAEQASFEQADVAFFLSHFLKDKVQGYGWRVDRAHHLPYCFEVLAETEPVALLPAAAAVTATPQSSLVFFGRLEERKGLFTFIAALQHLHDDPRIPRQLLFLGKSEPLTPPGCVPQTAQAYLDQTLSQSYTVHCLTDLFRQEAIALIRQLPNPIVCLTSLQENFPNAAIEMGQLPVRLVVADTGGYRETLGLIQRTEGVYWFVPGEARSLVAAIVRAVQEEGREITIPTKQSLETINHQLLQKRWNYLSSAFGMSTGRTWLLGMTSMEEQQFLENYAQHDYSGMGEIVELGCWFGSSTISLAMGLRQNKQVTNKQQRIHAYDLFVWSSQAGMADNVMGTELENRYQDGDSFLEEYLRRIQPWQDLINVHPGDLTQMPCTHEKIEFLFIDAMKSWELANTIFRNFFPALMPEQSIIVHQDFAHWYTVWIHLLMYRLRDYLQPIEHSFMWSSQAFRLVKAIPSDLLNQDYTFADFPSAEVEQAFDYSLSFTDPRIQSNVLAAKVFYFVRTQDLKRARFEFQQAIHFCEQHGFGWRELEMVQQVAQKYFGRDLSI
jgi:glycosyltransferase involved in cell wall biosynthesis